MNLKTLCILCTLAIALGFDAFAQDAAPVDDFAAYAWLSEMPGLDAPDALVALSARFPAPAGFTRVPVEKGSFAAWLRGLPLRTDRTSVLAYDGSEIDAPAAATVALDVGERDLQQCADTAIRLRAEYLWASDQADTIAFSFTSGDLAKWKDWRQGERFEIGDHEVTRTRKAKKSASRETFHAYLNTVFMYAGTRSLVKDMQSVGDDEPIEAGMVFDQGGSPGHAVMILDVAGSEDGRRVALVGQGYMPAQEMHVLEDQGAHVLDGVWFLLPGPGESLDTPSWKPFERSALLRF